MQQIRGYLYVAVQFACVGALLLTGPAVPPSLPAVLLLVVSVLLGLWAVLSMGLGRFRISPFLHPSGRLHRRGPYRFIRHPMYLALLMATFASVAGDFSPVRICVWLLLLSVLLQKLRMEETLLAGRHAEYATYAATTRRILPFLY